MQASNSNLRLVELETPHSIYFNENLVDLASERYTQSFHWHDCFELELVLDGSALHKLNKNEYRVQKGSMYLLSPADIHTLVPDSGSDNSTLRVINIRFSDTLISQSSFAEVLTAGYPLTVETDENELHCFCQLFGQMAVEKQCNGQYAEEILHYLFLSFLLKFLRLWHLQHTGENTEILQYAPYGNRDLSYIRKAVAYIKYNFRNNRISVPTIARVVCLSQNYFGTLFKKHMGVSCITYIRQMRLDFASTLLRNSQLTVSEIAEKSGYNSVPRFISEFRAVYGISPQKYRFSEEPPAEKRQKI